MQHLLERAKALCVPTGRAQKWRMERPPDAGLPSCHPWDYCGRGSERGGGGRAGDLSEVPPETGSDRGLAVEGRLPFHWLVPHLLRLKHELTLPWFGMTCRQGFLHRKFGPQCGEERGWTFKGWGLVGGC